MNLLKEITDGVQQFIGLNDRGPNAILVPEQFEDHLEKEIDEIKGIMVDIYAPGPGRRTRLLGYAVIYIKDEERIRVGLVL